jgi:predicted kinase
MSATFHLVCGSTGAGKTTHALALARELGAMHFSIDDWIVKLFGPDAPQPPHWPWIAERAARCERHIEAMALGRLGLSSVLDTGLMRADKRRALADAARAAGLGVKLHFVDVAAGERWQRVLGRKRMQGDTYRVTVTRPMFDFIETIWQEPDAAEMAALDGVRVETKAA